VKSFRQYPVSKSHQQILGFAEADQNSLAIGFNVETVQVPLLYAEFGISGLHCAVNS